jgi:hypothetical protein
MKPLAANSSETQPIHHAFSPCQISAQLAASVSSITTATSRFIG